MTNTPTGPPGPSAPAPRVLRVDVGRLSGAGASAQPWGAAPSVLAGMGTWGGGALALALLTEFEETRSPDPDAPRPLVVAVGECVRRGVPTAARATIASRAPLSGLLGEGQVGGELGRRLARVADALVIEGRTELPGAVLVVEADGRAHLESLPALVGVAPGPAQGILVERFGPCASLRVGPAGVRGVPIASLASGGEAPSFVGRGGLGAVLGGTGLLAVVVRAEEVPSMHAGEDFAARLASSPRLVARAEGGSFELLHLAAARGELSRERAELLGAGADGRAHRRTGCRGCPTPCGWVFDRPEEPGGRRHARFNATVALGADLGLASFDDTLALLAACDGVGVDAKEVAAGIGLAVRAEPDLAGDRDRFVAWIQALGTDPEGDSALAGLSRGARGVAAARGLDPGALVLARGQAVGPESGHAAILGQCVTPNGSDPMRSFPFLLEAGGRGPLEALLAPVELPAGAEDPDRPAGKGRLVWWHENLVAAVDMTGFCAFSAAGLLSDGITDLDELADWILPAALATEDEPGARLLAAGASLSLARRALERRYGAPAEVDRPAWARELLGRPGMLEEYYACRGLGPDGGPTRTAWERLGSEVLAAPVARLGAGDAGDAGGATRPEPSADPAPRGGGEVTVRASGPLAERLGAESRHRLAAPLPLAAFLASLDLPAASGAPSVYRDGARLGNGDLVAGGDTLELLVAIAGG